MAEEDRPAEEKPAPKEKRTRVQKPRATKEPEKKSFLKKISIQFKFLQRKKKQDKKAASKAPKAAKKVETVSEEGKSPAAAFTQFGADAVENLKPKNLLSKLPKPSLPQVKIPGVSGMGNVFKKFMPSALGDFFESHRKKIMIIAVVGVIGVVVFIFRGLFSLTGEDKQSLEELVASQPDAKEAAIGVKGFKVGRFNFEDSLNVLGTIKGAIEFKLAFEVPGVVSSINYREGERYEEGALLMSLRQDDILLRLKRAQAAARKAQNDLRIADDKVTEHKKLFDIGAIPKTTLEKVKKEKDGFKYEAEAARLEMKAHESMLEKSNLYSPSAGMIGELNVEEGETITPNTLLGSHIMTEFVFAEFGIVERDVKKIALGQKGRVFVDAYPDKTFEGVIENVAPVVAGSSRTATAKVRLENPERLLLPGMFCRIRVLLYSKKNTLVIPTDSIQGSEGEQWVFVLDTEKNVAVKRPITVGYTRPDYSQIDAGISEGEVIAISGLERLEDGKAVRVLETQEAEV